MKFKSIRRQTEVSVNKLFIESNLRNFQDWIYIGNELIKLKEFYSQQPEKRYDRMTFRQMMMSEGIAGIGYEQATKYILIVENLEIMEKLYFERDITDLTKIIGAFRANQRAHN